MIETNAPAARPRHRRVLLVAALLASALSNAAQAQAQANGDVIAELRQEIAALKAEQAKANQRIAELEGARSAVAAAPAAGASTAASQLAAATPVSAPPPPLAPAASRLTLSGDVRVRYESNFGDNDAPDRNRGVLRARLRAAYAVNKWLTVGGQLATGDPGDPNTTDITLSGFDNKLQASLDQAYIRIKSGHLQVDAGRIAQPFVRTELVWDGDVSPQGISAAYAMPLGGGANLKATGLYFLVDEAAAGPDSTMFGGQVGLDFSPSSQVKFELAAGYYDYTLNSLAGGDSGDFRSNVFSGGKYLSDFNLLDVIAAVNWNGLGAKWPVRVVGDYVHNFGAVGGEDSGFGIDLILGRASKPHDWRFTYGYAEAETDAVMAAYSHDNTNIATNYLQHTFAVDYTVAPNLILTGTYYRYRPKNPVYAGTNQATDWLNRLRINALVTF